MFDTQMVFLKEFFEKVDFENNQQTTKKRDNSSGVGGGGGGGGKELNMQAQLCSGAIGLKFRLEFSLRPYFGYTGPQIRVCN